MAAGITANFNRYRFVVDIEVDDDAYLEASPFPEHAEAGAALESEIRANLQSLDGIYRVTVEPIA